jgi:hypothetical protein
MLVLWVLNGWLRLEGRRRCPWKVVVLQLRVDLADSGGGNPAGNPFGSSDRVEKIASNTEKDRDPV